VKPKAVHTADHPPVARQRTERIEVIRSIDNGCVEYVIVDGVMFVPRDFAAKAERPKYAPNKKYQDEDFKRFEYWYEVKQSQEQAYDELVREQQGRFDSVKFKSFVDRYRVWRDEQSKLGIQPK
jgi:hypothetical protein